MYLLLIEDDLSLGRVLSRLLAQHYRVDWVRTLAAASAQWRAAEHDLVILDLGLPDGDGMDWLAGLRAGGSGVPVLIVSARDALDDRVHGLDAGADDYLIKPFEADELMARVRVLLRRGSGRATPALSAGALSFLPDKQRFLLDGEPLALPPMAYQLLAVLMAAGDRPVSRERLERQLYGLGDGSDSNTLEVHVHALRKLIGRERIETVRGFGYRLVAL